MRVQHLYLPSGAAHDGGFGDVRSRLVQLDLGHVRPADRPLAEVHQVYDAPSSAGDADELAPMALEADHVADVVLREPDQVRDPVHVLAVGGLAHELRGLLGLGAVTVPQLPCQRLPQGHRREVDVHPSRDQLHLGYEKRSVVGCLPGDGALHHRQGLLPHLGGQLPGPGAYLEDRLVVAAELPGTPLADRVLDADRGGRPVFSLVAEHVARHSHVHPVSVRVLLLHGSGHRHRDGVADDRHRIHGGILHRVQAVHPGPPVPELVLAAVGADLQVHMVGEHGQLPPSEPAVYAQPFQGLFAVPAAFHAEAQISTTWAWRTPPISMTDSGLTMPSSIAMATALSPTMFMMVMDFILSL